MVNIFKTLSVLLLFAVTVALGYAVVVVFGESLKSLF